MPILFFGEQIIIVCNSLCPVDSRIICCHCNMVRACLFLSCFCLLGYSFTLLVVQQRYTLTCPRCNEELCGMFFCESDGNPDEHGLVSCSKCVSYIARLAGLCRNNWRRIASEKDYCRFPRSSWQVSLTRTSALLERAAAAAEEAPRRRRGRKRKRGKKKAAAPRDLQSEPAASASSSATSASASTSTTDAATQTAHFDWNLVKTHVVQALKTIMAINAGKHDVEWRVVQLLIADLDTDLLEKHMPEC